MEQVPRAAARRRHLGGMAAGASAGPVSSSSYGLIRRQITAAGCPGSGLSGLRAADVSSWVTKFSSFCQAKQHRHPLGSSHRFPEAAWRAGAVNPARWATRPSARTQVETPGRGRVCV